MDWTCITDLLEDTEVNQLDNRVRTKKTAFDWTKTEKKGTR
jgi:hypothetical protein